MEFYVFPWAVGAMEFGEDVLELGPGYGISTDLLLPKCVRLTCLESDSGLARSLERHMHSTKATVVCGDARSMQLLGEVFDTAVCFMMLHHVTPASAQDQMFSEIIRVLKPGGIFAGADSPSSFLLRAMHAFDTVCMVDPLMLATRLEAAGFEDVQVSASRYAFRFRAHKPMNRFPIRVAAADADHEDTEQCSALAQVT